MRFPSGVSNCTISGSPGPAPVARVERVREAVAPFAIAVLLSCLRRPGCPAPRARGAAPGPGGAARWVTCSQVHILAEFGAPLYRRVGDHRRPACDGVAPRVGNPWREGTGYAVGARGVGGSSERGAWPAAGGHTAGRWAHGGPVNARRRSVGRTVGWWPAWVLAPARFRMHAWCSDDATLSRWRPRSPCLAPGAVTSGPLSRSCEVRPR